jgi:hypothetical protein
MSFTITTQYADGRIETREATPEEVAQRDADIAAAEAQRAHEESVMAAREAALASAKSKLAELGLTDEEISALRNELIEL